MVAEAQTNIDKFFQAASSCDLDQLKDTIGKLQPGEINSHNVNKENALGCILLSDKDYDLKIEAAKLLISNPAFDVNRYLLMGNHQDVTSGDPKGGLNALHWAIVYNMPKLIELLKSRNTALKDSGCTDHGKFANFDHPSTHPKYHMFSPEHLMKKYNRDFDLPTREDSNYPDNWSDASGDSDVEGTRAHYYKDWMTRLFGDVQEDQGPNPPQTPAKLKQLAADASSPKILLAPEKKAEVDEFVDSSYVAHFHGMPFMSNAFTPIQRFELAQQIFEGVNFLDNDPTCGIHSRTSTISAGIEHVGMLQDADEETLSELKRSEDSLRKIFQEMFKGDNEEVRALLTRFIHHSTEKNDTKNEHHEAFWSAVSKFCDDNGLADELANVTLYRFPFLSTSKMPDHTIIYGGGQHLEVERGELGVDPGYDDSGVPKHRLAGFVYIIKHSVTEYRDLVDAGLVHDIPLLHGKNDLVSVTDRHAIGLKGRYHNQLEVTFISDIAPENIVAAVPLLYPNLSKPYNPDYHGEILGLSAEEYSDLKTKTSDPDMVLKFYTKLCGKLALSLGGEDQHLVAVSPEHKLVSLTQEGFALDGPNSSVQQKEFASQAKSKVQQVTDPYYMNPDPKAEDSLINDSGFLELSRISDITSDVGNESEEMFAQLQGLTLDSEQE